MKPFPWQEAMQFGFGVLRLNSKDFWCLTPIELVQAYRAFTLDEKAPMDRACFENLMSKYPDEEKNNE